jgi:2'-5' RNA ligase
VAIELDQTHHRLLSDLQADLKRERAARVVRWVDPENIHLTVKFLGEVDSSMMTALEGAVKDACSGTVPFALKLAGAGAFPNSQRPNVIWVGLAGAVDQVSTLAKKIDDACAALGFPREERAFSPHLTLGRVKRDALPGDRQTLGALIARAQVGDADDLRVDKVSLMKSELRPAGSVYTRMALIQLTAGK